MIVTIEVRLAERWLACRREHQDADKPAPHKRPRQGEEGASAPDAKPKHHDSRPEKSDRALSRERHDSERPRSDKAERSAVPKESSSAAHRDSDRRRDRDKDERRVEDRHPRTSKERYLPCLHVLASHTTPCGMK